MLRRRGLFSVASALSMGVLLTGFTSGCQDSFLPQDGPGNQAIKGATQLRAAQVGPGRNLQYALIDIEDHSRTI